MRDSPLKENPLAALHSTPHYRMEVAHTMAPNLEAQGVCLKWRPSNTRSAAPVLEVTSTAAYTFGRDDGGGGGGGD